VIHETIGRLCREARESRGLSQTDVAPMTHFDRRTISDYERGERTENQFRYAVKLARALNDMALLRSVIAVETGVPVAGSAIPDGVDRHVAALRDLAIKEKTEAVEALAQVTFWRIGPEQLCEVERAACEIVDAIASMQWLYDALCMAVGIDPDDLMSKRRFEMQRQFGSAPRVA